jgi:hypothetical protein
VSRPLLSLLLAWRGVRRHPPWLSLLAVAVLVLALLITAGVATGLTSQLDRRIDRVQGAGVENEYFLTEGRLRVIIPFEDVDDIGEIQTHDLATDEMLISPALARLLETSPGGEVAARLPYRSVGSLPDGILTHPGELLAVTGARAAFQPWAQNIGGPPLLGVVSLGMVALLPLTVLLATALRSDARRRERRLQLLSTLGAPRSVSFGAGLLEALLVSALGLLIAAPVYAAALPLVAQLSIAGGGFFPGDLVPAAAAAAAVILVVLVTTLGVAAVTHRRRRERHGSRSRGQGIPKFLLAGIALMVVAAAASDALAEPVLASAEGIALLLAVIGIAREGPGLSRGLATLVLRAGQPSAARLVALRRIDADPLAAYRAVTGLALVSFVLGYVSPLTLGGDASASAAGAEQVLNIEPAEGDTGAVLDALTSVDGAGVVMTALAGSTAPQGQVTTCAGARLIFNAPLAACGPGVVYVIDGKGPTGTVASVGVTSNSSGRQAIQPTLTKPAPGPPRLDLMARGGDAFGYIAVVGEAKIREWPIAAIRMTADGRARFSAVRAIVAASPEALVGSPEQLGGADLSRASLRFAVGALGLLAGLLTLVSILIALAEANAQRLHAGLALNALGASAVFRRREQAWRVSVPLFVGAPLSFLTGSALSLSQVWLLGGDGAVPWVQFAALMVGFAVTSLLAVGLSGLVGARSVRFD